METMKFVAALRRNLADFYEAALDFKGAES